MAAYSIPEMNIENLEKKLVRIRNKAEKYGCDFHYERTGEHFETIDTDERDEHGKPRKQTVRFIDIEVEGRVEVGGWQFAATLDYTDNGNLIAGVEGLEIPERYYNCSPWCEHCKTRRDRKNSYIVYKAETGEYKQVGRGCLKDFTNGLSAEAVAQYESWIKVCEEASDLSGLSLGGWGTDYYQRDEFMAITAEVIRIYGYTKRDAEGLTVSTAERAGNLYSVVNGMRLGPAKEYILAQYEDAMGKGFDPKNESSVTLAKTVREWILNNDRNDNYYHNLKVACSGDYITWKTLGLVVSAFPAHNRDLEYQAEKAEQERKAKDAAAKSSWAGQIGDKVVLTIASVRTITSWETQWGMTMVYKIIDTDGREFTWKTSNWLDEERSVGKVLKGTVKEQKEFRGIKQTEITRCRIA